MKLSVIIPAFNEARTVREIIARVQGVTLDKEIIVVDDGSTDGTQEILRGLREKDLRVVFHERNRGKGAAIRTGIGHARGEITIIQDADLEYDPREYHRLIEPIVDGRAEVVYGSRFLGGPHRVLFFWHYVGNKFLTLVCNMLSNLNLSDMESGYKVFLTDILRNIRIRSNRFGFEPEITMKVAKRRCRIYETPISYMGRDYTEGKKIRWTDGVIALWCLIRYRLID
jgi:glycosyltransferase involved in cell wall biosynthesis